MKSSLKDAKTNEYKFEDLHVLKRKISNYTVKKPNTTITKLTLRISITECINTACLLT